MLRIPLGVDAVKAREIWAEYQRQHDASDRMGQAVGIDPVSGRIWFGRKALDMARQMRAEGIDRPFYCAPVGSDFNGHKEVVDAQRLLNRTGMAVCRNIF